MNKLLTFLSIFLISTHVCTIPSDFINANPDLENVDSDSKIIFDEKAFINTKKIKSVRKAIVEPIKQTNRDIVKSVFTLNAKKHFPYQNTYLIFLNLRL